MDHDEQMRRIYATELPTRVDRPLPKHRVDLIEEFIALARDRGLGSVLEVGCGAGRDGVRLRDAGLSYVGVDLSPVGVGICRHLGLTAVEASATALPFRDATFDAGWTMSTLMHLPADDFDRAVAELGRVIRPGGVLEVAVWGAEESGVRTDESGRYFRLRTDDEVRVVLETIGELESFATRHLLSDGGRYQWARLRVG